MASKVRFFSRFFEGLSETLDKGSKENLEKDIAFIERALQQGRGVASARLGNLTYDEAKDKLRVLKNLDYSSDSFTPIGNFVFLMGSAIFVRLVLTFLYNLFISAPFYAYLAFGAEIVTVFDEPVAVLTLVGGYTAWNIVQGLSDSILSYLIVFPAKLNKVFGIW